MNVRTWSVVVGAVSIVSLGCARERPAEEPRRPPPRYVTTYEQAPAPQPAFRAIGAAETPLATGIVLVQTPPLASILAPLLLAAACVTPPSPPVPDPDACGDQALVRISNPRILSRGRVWRAGEEAQLVVDLTSPRTNANYTGFRASQTTRGVTPEISQVHPSQSLLPNRPTAIGDLVRADRSVAPGTKVTFHIVVSPGEACPGIQAIDFETVIR
jgi:hypothetical protein